MHNHDDGVVIFNVTDQGIRIVDKYDMKPHYVLCSVDNLNLVIYYFGDDGGGSTLLQHWVGFPKFLKEKNKKRGLMETKKQKYFKNIYKGK